MSELKKLDNDPIWAELEIEDRRMKKIPKWNNPNLNFNEEYAKLLVEYNTSLEKSPKIKEGDVVTGIIESISKKEIIININYKDNVYVDNKISDLKIVENLKLGDEIEILLTKVSDKPYFIKGSIAELLKLKVSNKLKNSFEHAEILNAKVVEKIAAGFMLDIEMDDITINAFMPNTLASVNKLTAYQTNELVGQRINVCLENLEQEKGVYVVSRKKYLLKYEFPKEIKKLEKNKEYTGFITGTRPFGVFVQFNNCLTGMIHKSNFHEDYREKLSEIAHGTEVTFYVKDILKNGKEIILTQYLRESLLDKIRTGLVLEGTIKNIKEYGVLIELDNETFGVIRTTTLQKYGKSIKDGEEGKKVKVKVIEFYRDERKIFLSLL
jgi:small subunit ribosomal protein S1